MTRGVLRINPYEARYRQLLANEVSAWASDGLVRTKIQQEKTFHWLDTHDYLSAPGTSVPELGYGNGVMAVQYLAERGYAVSSADVPETTIHQTGDCFQQVGLDATFFVGNVYRLSQREDVQLALIIDGSRLHCLLEDECRRFFAETGGLLKPAGRLVIGSVRGLPHYAEGLAAYDPIKHHLLKEGQSWRAPKPLPALLNKVQQVQFGVLTTDVKHNAWWDHVTTVCPTNGPSADPQRS